MASEGAPHGWGSCLAFLRAHRFVTFLLMSFSFVIFGIMTVNLFFVFKANLDFLAAHGSMALADGGFLQFLQLLLASLLALAFYLLFKVCEKILVDSLTHD